VVWVGGDIIITISSRNTSEDERESGRTIRQERERVMERTR